VAARRPATDPGARGMRGAARARVGVGVGVGSGRVRVRVRVRVRGRGRGRGPGSDSVSESESTSDWALLYVGRAHPPGQPTVTKIVRPIVPGAFFRLYPEAPSVMRSSEPSSPRTRPLPAPPFDAALAAAASEHEVACYQAHDAARTIGSCWAHSLPSRPRGCV
jgi:hypothetical protein